MNGAGALAARWSDYLQHDRRRSPHTVRAYVATAHRLIEFLGRYRGEEIAAAGLLDLEAVERAQHATVFHRLAGLLRELGVNEG